MAVPKTYFAILGEDAEFATLVASALNLAGVDVVTALLLASGQVADLNGEAYGLVLDADADTAIGASVDDVVNIKIAGAEDFRILANIFRALSGSVIETNTINETTSANGVVVDSVTLKDGGIILADAAAIAVDVVSEKVSGAGVTIDSATLKDGRSNLGRTVQPLTASGAISIKSGLVTLAHATVVIAATLAAPVAGDELFISNTSASGTVAHTVTLGAGVTFVGGSDNTATFDAPGETLHMIAVSATKWLIIENIGSVALSAA